MCIQVVPSRRSVIDCDLQTAARSEDISIAGVWGQSCVRAIA